MTEIDEPQVRWGAQEILDVLARKWTLMVIYMLRDEPKRYLEIQRLVQGITRKMLTQTLRNLERDGFVQRMDYSGIVRRVEYTLTPLGRSVLEPITTLLGWAEINFEHVKQNRVLYDQVVETK